MKVEITVLNGMKVLEKKTHEAASVDAAVDLVRRTYNHPPRVPYTVIESRVV